MDPQTPPTEPVFRNQWLRGLDSTTGRIAIISASLAAIVAMLQSLFGVLRNLGLKENSPWAVPLAVIVIVLGVIFYVKEVRRLRQEPLSRPLSVFIGADSFSEKDRDLFFGRDTEILSISRKLDDPEIRFLILYGDSGCGKTSLIRAGLVPKIRHEDQYVPIYVRFYASPEKYLREALASLFKAESGAAQVAGGDHSQDRKLARELELASIQRGKPILIFIDQFEEFFTNQISEEEQLLVCEFVRACVSWNGLNRPKLVLSVRRDYFDRMSMFDTYVDDIFRQANRVRIELFDRERAMSIIRQSLSHADSRRRELPWSEALVDRIVDDLEIRRRDPSSNSDRTIILPTEMQIVCQMVQMRGWSEARQFPGKERLIRDYVSDSIETSPNALSARRILLALIHENGITRARPQTAAQIAEGLAGLDKVAVLRILKYLDSPCRLVNHVLRTDNLGGHVSEAAYELAHEYLVGVINSLSGAVMDEVRAANILLHECRVRATYTTTLRLTFKECLRIRRYATEELDSKDRQLISRSERYFAFKMTCYLAAPLLAILGLRYCFVHFAIDYGGGEGRTRVVVRQGLSFLTPILGSSSDMIDSGFSTLDISDTGRNMCLAGKNVWAPLGSEAFWKPLYQWRLDRLNSELSDRRISDSAVLGIAELGALDENLKSKLIDELKNVEDAYDIARTKLSALGALLYVEMPDSRLSQILIDQITPRCNGPLKNWYERDFVTAAIVALPIAGGKDDVAKQVLLTCLSQNVDPEIIEELGQSLVSLNTPRQKLEDLLILKLKDDHFTAPAARAIGSLRDIDSRLASALVEASRSLKVDTASLVDAVANAKPVPLEVRNRLLEIFRAPSIKQRFFFQDEHSAAAVGLVLLGFQDDNVREAVIQCAAKEFCDTRSWTAIGMFNKNTESLITLFSNKLASKESRYLDAVYRSLRHLKLEDPRIIQILIEQTKSPETQRAILAASALGEMNIQHDVVVSALTECLQSSQPTLRLQAIISLRKLGLKESKLDKIATDSIDWVTDSYGRQLYVRLVLDQASMDFKRRVDGLLAELRSSKAEKSSGYRVSVEEAIILLIRRHYGETLGGKDGQSYIRSTLEGWVNETNVVHRISANRILMGIGYQSKLQNHNAFPYPFSLPPVKGLDDDVSVE